MKIKINIGCGKRNFGKDWIHIDEADFSHIDEKNIFNISYNNVDLIYASHLISYFDYDQVNTLLSHWRDRLKYKGILRLAVPDFKKITYLYSKGYSLNSFLGPLYGKMKLNDDIIYHKYCYDEKLLTELLIKNKFKKIRKWDHKTVDHGIFDDHSQAYLPHMDKENGTLISLNMECEK